MKGRFGDVRVKNVEPIDLAKCGDERLEAWSKAEGWSPNAGRGYGTKYGPGVQVHYEAIPGQEILKQRSEEHTSELQSLMRISYAVFCLKKKNKTTQTTRQRHNIKHV